MSWYPCLNPVSRCLRLFCNLLDISRYLLQASISFSIWDNVSSWLDDLSWSVCTNWAVDINWVTAVLNATNYKIKDWKNILMQITILLIIVRTQLRTFSLILLAFSTSSLASLSNSSALSALSLSWLTTVCTLCLASASCWDKCIFFCCRLSTCPSNLMIASSFLWLSTLIIRMSAISP